MANEFDLAKADGLFKDTYGSLTDIRPSSAVVQRLVPYSENAKVGDSYIEAIEVQAPQGITHSGAATTVSALKGVRNAVIVQASSKGFETVLREQVQYKVLSQAVSAGKTAFKSAMDCVVKGMQKSIANRLEANIIHGQRGWGVVESVADGGSSTVVVTMTAASWSSGLWYSAIGATFDALTSTTKNNGDGPLILTKVDVANRAVTFSHSGTYSDQVQAADVIHPEGCGTGTAADFLGLMAQAENLTGTTLGISATTYAGWAGNTYDAAGPFSFRIFQDALHRVRSRGGDVGRLVALMGRPYSTLVSELGEMGKLDLGTAKKVTAGVKGISYDAGLDLGEVDLVFHPFMRDGEVCIFPADETVRGGATDIAFGVPGMGEKMFQFVAGYNAVELQALYDQLVIIKKPCASMVISGITHN